MDRKTFFKIIIGTLVIVLPVAFIIGCSNSDDVTGNPGPKEAAQSKCIENGAVGSIELNHGHSLTIPKEDVVAAKRET